jgi:CxxC motif-containing protein
MTAITHYLCIGCPLGCRLEVEAEKDTIVEVRGFSCKLGKEYAEREHTDPRRLVSTTVRVVNGIWARLPVKTSAAIAKHRVGDVCRALRAVRVVAPVAAGDLIVANILDSGADIVATRDMPAARDPAD